MGDTEFEAEQFVVDMQWNNMSHQGHSAHQVGEWMKQSEKINCLVDSHQKVAAAMGPVQIIIALPCHMRSKVKPTGKTGKSQTAQVTPTKITLTEM